MVHDIVGTKAPDNETAEEQTARKKAEKKDFDRIMKLLLSFDTEGTTNPTTLAHVGAREPQRPCRTTADAVSAVSARLVDMGVVTASPLSSLCCRCDVGLGCGCQLRERRRG